MDVAEVEGEVDLLWDVGEVLALVPVGTAKERGAVGGVVGAVWLSPGESELDFQLVLTTQITRLETRHDGVGERHVVPDGIGKDNLGSYGVVWLGYRYGKTLA